LKHLPTQLNDSSIISSSTHPFSKPPTTWLVSINFYYLFINANYFCILNIN
jgi:hypothetical protein